jgi:hypothetical protein
MEDTTEIVERLERIGALAGAGAERSDLLREVRGLLEEGERRLRCEPGGEDLTQDAGARGGGPRAGDDDGSVPSARDGVGEEATVA